MNNEQNDNDALVSAAYRDSAQETTPPQLDEAVLRMANSKPGTTTKPFSAWLIPLTWTVTAGLCVALVMNIPGFETDGAPTPAPASPAASIEEMFSAEEADVVQEAEKIASMRDGPDQPAPVARARQQLEKRVNESHEDTDVTRWTHAAETSISTDTVAQETVFEKKESARNAVCDEASRREAESWYECVLALRESGRSQDADSEMLKLVEQFPGFLPE